MQTSVARTHLVLVGGGHSHATVVRAFGMRPEPGVVITLIAKELDAPYSGMLPGLVAGHYDHAQCHIDLVRLASWAGARLVHGIVTGIDRATRRVQVEGRPPIAYDLLSIDVGITPRLSDIAGAEEHAIPVKPVSSFAPRWEALEAAALTANGPRHIAVVGSGAAGFELILAARHRLLTMAPSRGIDPQTFTFTLIGGEMLLPEHNITARRLARREISHQSVELIEGDRAAAIAPGVVTLQSGRKVEADAVMISTNAGPAPWFAASGLPTDVKGFIAVRPTLQLTDDDDVFAVGDCATVLEHPRPKAGVFAVRQGPPLTENLRLRARGEKAKPFTPQKQFLTILSAGRAHAIAARGPFAVGGGWVWTWKDWIDRKFMRLFHELRPMMPKNEVDALAMRCAGCAAKIGPVTLARALDRLDADNARSRDDAIVIAESDGRQRVETVDFFRAFWPEPYVLGEVAACHAMSDVLAMGGRPSHALATIVLPFAQPARLEEDLFQVLSGARAAFSREGVKLAGGHSGEGAELAAGFFVSGQVAGGELLRKGGLRPGDRLVLTRALGTGVLLAGLMHQKAAGADVMGAITRMRQSQGPIARALLGYAPSAGTDVTGFGLAGHLMEMLEASGMDASLDLAAVPIYPGALALAGNGVASTLLPENARRSSALEGEARSDAATIALLFDPQTAGGLLAGVGADTAEDCVTALRAAGADDARIIGSVQAPVDGRGGRIRLAGQLA